MTTNIKKSAARKSTSLLNSIEEVKVNIQKSVAMLNAKGYPCECEDGNSTISKYPYISFEERITDYSFLNIPEELFAERKYGNYVIGLQAASKKKKAVNAVLNSELLLKWVRGLKKARSVYCEIDVPLGVEPEEFFDWAVADEFDVDCLDYDGSPEDADDSEPKYTITFELIVSPNMTRILDKSIREFGGFHEVMATTTVL